jgi:hypothetical protein
MALRAGFYYCDIPNAGMARSYTSACISNYTGQRVNGLTGKPANGQTDKGGKGESLPRGFALAF